MARPPKPFHLKAQDKKELKLLLSGGIQQVGNPGQGERDSGMIPNGVSG
jgi:hypothetical protein